MMRPIPLLDLPRSLGKYHWANDFGNHLPASLSLLTAVQASVKDDSFKSPPARKRMTDHLIAHRLPSNDAKEMLDLWTEPFEAL